MIGKTRKPINKMPENFNFENTDPLDVFKVLSGMPDLETDAVELLRFEIGNRLFFYGAHFENPFERDAMPRRHYLKKSFQPLKQFLHNVYFQHQSFTGTGYSGTICSNAYFGIDEDFKQFGYTILPPPPISLPAGSIYRNLRKLAGTLRRIINHGTLVEILDLTRSTLIKNYISEAAAFFAAEKIRALVVPYDLPFWERVNILAARLADIPSFIFLHGIPGRYNLIDDNWTDFIAVWGKAIRGHYLAADFKTEKLLVIGHPRYRSYTGSVQEKPGDILVTTYGMNGSQHSDKARGQNRGNLISYVYSIQRALAASGITCARLRPHPSENQLWYADKIDRNFYSLDTAPLTQSLQVASLIIGAPSTLIIDSAYLGRTYIVYEPLKTGQNLLDFSVVPPFDGSDPRLPVVRTEEELCTMIKSKPVIGKEFFTDYVELPFNLQPCLEKINEWWSKRSAI